MIILLKFLKIVGILLLIILGILLFCLFSPVKYSADIKKHDKLKARFAIKWLYGIIGIKAVYNEKLNAALTIFGRNFRGGKKTKKAESVKECAEKFTQHDEKNEPKETITVLPEKDDGKKEEVSDMPRVRRVKMSEVDESNINLEHTEETTKAQPSEEADEKKDNKWVSFLKQFSLSELKAVLNQVLLLIKRFMRTVLPKTLKIKGRFGLGDPALTGEALGFIYAAGGLIADEIEVYGNFTEAEFKGEISFEGKIRPIYLIYIGFRFLLSKPVFRAIRLYLKGNR